jgi:PAS domain S-box-containing protein
VSPGLRGYQRHSLTVWLGSILLPVAGLLTRLLLWPVAGRSAPYLTFFLAAAASAAMGGFGPGLLATFTGALLAGFILPGRGWLHMIDPADPFGLLRYLVAGTVVCWICGALISSRERARRAEERMRESERIYRAIGESIPFGIWMTNPAGDPLYVSEAMLALTGMKQEDWRVFGWSRAIHPEDAARIAPEWDKCRREEGTLDVEVRYRSADGHYHPVLMRSVPVRDDRGQIVSWAGINLDIARQKETEAKLNGQTEELRRSNQDLEQFAFVASHDMQEPLRMVNIYTQLLLRKIAGRDFADVDQFAGYIHEGVGRMERLIRDLLHYSRVIHGEPDSAAVDAYAAAREALEVNRRLVEESRAEVVIDPLPAVMASDAQLLLVFQNLMSNAIKYRKPDAAPRIRISADVSAGRATFRVTDNGLGFDPAYSGKVFKLFTRLHGKNYEGTGLGLAICKRIVERYGGSIGVKTEPDVGSTFSFTLAAAQSEVESHAAISGVRPSE